MDGCRQALGEEKLRELQVVAVSNPIPNEVVAVPRTLRMDVARKIAHAFRIMRTAPGGAASMQDVFNVEGFSEGGPSESTTVRDALKANMPQ